MKQLGIKGSMQGAEAAWADKCIAEFFYANAIPFGAACTEPSGLYRRMISAIKATPAGYKPPNYNKLGGELLDSCYDGMWKSMKDRDPDGALMYKYGSTYVTDGWDSCDNLSLINSAFITKNDGGIFWRSVDTSGKIKCAEYTAALMIQDIYAYGPTKVVLVVTDTCSVMQKAWDIVMFEFPWISVLPCQPHVISLLLKDIGKTAEVRSMPSACARRGCLYGCVVVPRVPDCQCSCCLVSRRACHSSCASLCTSTDHAPPPLPSAGDQACSGGVDGDAVVLKPPLPPRQAARDDAAHPQVAARARQSCDDSIWDAHAGG